MGVQGPDRKRLAIIGGVGVVVVGALAVFALSRGGGGGGSASPTSSTRSSASAATAPRRLPTASTTTTTAVATMPDSFQTFTERNPFQPSVDLGTAGGTTPTTAVAGAPAAPSPTATTTAGTGTAAAPGKTTGAGSVASPGPGAGTAVQLLSVSSAGGAPTASVQVGSTVYTVTPGQSFATSYKLVSLSGSCGKFLFGDSPFSLCTGEQVLK
jgi:hypothetical protein